MSLSDPMGSSGAATLHAEPPPGPKMRSAKVLALGLKKIAGDVKEPTVVIGTVGTACRNC